MTNEKTLVEMKNTPMRDSAIIYASNLEQIRKMFEKDPIKAGELAISLCEMALTGEISSTDMYMEIILENYKTISSRAANAYDEKKEAKEQAKKDKMQLDKIAEKFRQGKKQSEIAADLNLSKQTVSYRLNKIKAEYPELLGQIATPAEGASQEPSQKSKNFTF